MAEPAWKKLGLKVSEGSEGISVAHIDSAQLTSKDKKAINKQKRKLEQDQGAKKPPKRIKVAKSERKPPPEKDQLAYLRQYLEDRQNWKFSKQKQNWILKNVESIPDNYHHQLVAYLEGIQGGSRQRLVDEMQAVVRKWNEAAAKAQRTIEEKEEEKEEQGENELKEEDADKEENGKKDEGPTYTYAARCRDIIEALTEERLWLDGVDESDSQGKEEAGKGDKEEHEEEDEDEDEEEKRDVEDNLIIEEVDVAGIQPEAPLEFEKEKKEYKEHNKEKKDKKEKKEKKDKKGKKEKKDKKDKAKKQ